MDHKPLVVLRRAECLAVDLTAVELHLLNGLTPSEEAVQQEFDPWRGIVSTNRARRENGFRPRYPPAWAAEAEGAL